VDPTGQARRRDVDGHVLDRYAVEEEVVERRRDVVALEAEQDMDPRGLDVGVDDADPHTLAGQLGRHVGREVRLAGPTTE